MYKKNIQNTVKFKDFSKIKGLNSGKNNSITLKHELALSLLSTKTINQVSII
jgi:hypothetical protein